MSARIYQPAKSAMQSGRGNSANWVLDYEPEQARGVEPLMGYTSSSDMKSQIRLEFETKQEALDYAERHNILCHVSEPKIASRKRISYSDNFGFYRNIPWTH